MWARRLRHRTLDLDTLPYEVDEEDSVELAPLFENPESMPNIKAEPELISSTPVETANSVQSDNLVDGEWDELDQILGLNSELICQNAELFKLQYQTTMLSQPTRIGCVRKRPRHLTDFVV